MPPKQAPVAKSLTKQQCLQNAKKRLNGNNMSCGTDPDPSNAFCYQKNYSDYRKQSNFCHKL